MPDTIKARIGFQPKAHQRRVLLDKKRHRGVVFHRRAGKTVMAIFDLLDGLLSCKLTEPRVAYIAPFQKQAKRLAWDYLCNTVSRGNAQQYFTIHQSDLTVTFEPTNGKFMLLGADNIDAIRGMYFDRLAADELADMDPRLWPTVLRPALADRQGRALLMGTPKGRANMLYELSKVSPDDPEWSFHLARADQTGMIADKELQALQREMSAPLYEQEFMCSFNAALLGAVYGSEMNALQHDRYRPFVHDESLPVYTSWDLGWADATAVVYWQIAGNELRIIDYDEFTLTSLAAAIAVVRGKPYQYLASSHYAPHDIAVTELGSGKSRALIAQELGVDFIKVPNWSLEDGIEATRAILSRVWINSANCERLLECLVNYEYEFDDKARTFKNRPRHNWTSHAVDAIRMFAVGHAGGMGRSLKRALADEQQWLL